MGSFFSKGKVTSLLKQPIENMMFRPPYPEYDRDHPKLTFFGPINGRVACMCNIVNTKPMIILYAHGNSCDIGRVDNFLETLSKNLDINIISYDYEGYGLTMSLNPNVTPTVNGAIRSTETVYNALVDKLKIHPSNIILYGTSIGTGPMVKLAANLAESGIHVHGILLQTPYTSIFGLGMEMICGFGAESVETSFNYVGNVVTNTNIFTSYEDIKKIKSPIVIIHGLKDEIIPYSNAQRLHKLAQQSRLITLPDANHNNIESVPEHLHVLEQAIRDLIHR